MSDAPKPMGRPRKRPEMGRRGNYSFRMGDLVRDQIIDAAARNGRSMSEELEARIEASLRSDEMRAVVRQEMQAVINGLLIDKFYTTKAALVQAVPVRQDGLGHNNMLRQDTLARANGMLGQQQIFSGVDRKLYEAN